MVSLFKEQFDHLFHQIPDSEKKSLLDYMEYLAERAAQKAWDQMEEVDEPLSDEEKKELAEAKTGERENPSIQVPTWIVNPPGARKYKCSPPRRFLGGVISYPSSFRR